MAFLEIFQEMNLPLLYLTCLSHHSSLFEVPSAKLKGLVVDSGILVNRKDTAVKPISKSSRLMYVHSLTVLDTM